jgi:poly-beta-hydroxyalkanoate depolymerase
MVNKMEKVKRIQENLKDIKKEINGYISNFVLNKTGEYTSNITKNNYDNLYSAIKELDTQKQVLNFIKENNLKIDFYDEFDMANYNDYLENSVFFSLNYNIPKKFTEHKNKNTFFQLILDKNLFEEFKFNIYNENITYIKIDDEYYINISDIVINERSFTCLI